MKKKLLTVFGVLVFISAFSECSQANDQATMFRGNLERTGVYNAGNKIPSGELKWRYKAEFDMLSSPVISQGVVYVSGTGGYLAAVDASTGQKSWVFEREKWAGSAPAVSNGMVYVGSMDNDVYAVDRKTGLEKWKFETGNYVFSSPAVSDGVVYFGNYDGYLYALNANTGQEKWKFKTQGTGFLAPGREAATDYGLMGAIDSSPAISKGVVYFGSYDHYLYALDANTGQEKWKFKTGDIIGNDPAVAGNIIYFGSDDGYLYAVDNNGLAKWKFSTKDFVTAPSQSTWMEVGWVSSPTIANGAAYFSTSYQWREHSYDESDNRLDTLFAIDLATGRIKWKIPTTGGLPTVSGKVVYFGDHEGYVFALDAETGHEQWKYKADSGIYSEVVVVDGIAYFCSENGYLYALQ